MSTNTAKKLVGKVALRTGASRGAMNRGDTNRRAPSISHQPRSKRVPAVLTGSDAAKAVVRRNTEEVQSRGNFEVFEELFADDFVDHTPQPNMTPDKAGVRKLYGYIREAFPDFYAEIHWQLAEGDRVTTYKTYYGTHEGPLLGVAPTRRQVHFESVDVMRVRDGKTTDHWGVGNLLSLMQQIGAWIPPAEATSDESPKTPAMIELVSPNDARAVRNKDNVLALYDLMINKKGAEACSDLNQKEI